MINLKKKKLKTPYMAYMDIFVCSGVKMIVKVGFLEINGVPSGLIFF